MLKQLLLSPDCYFLLIVHPSPDDPCIRAGVGQLGRPIELARLQGDRGSTRGARRRNGDLRSVDVAIAPDDQGALSRNRRAGCSPHAAARAGDDANFS
jgi:hypothetical protein